MNWFFDELDHKMPGVIKLVSTVENKRVLIVFHNFSHCIIPILLCYGSVK